MSFATTTDFKAALGGWLQADDLEARYDDFITVAESRFNRDLRVRAMEDTLVSTALVDGAISLPANFLAFKELRYDGNPNRTLEPRPLEWIRSLPDSATPPLYFAVSGTQVVCHGQAGSIKGTFYRSIPSLTANADNWLLLAHPDLYLFACLEEAAIFTNDMERGRLWGGRAAALLQQIQGADAANAISGGPLSIRPR